MPDNIDSDSGSNYSDGFHGHNDSSDSGEEVPTRRNMRSVPNTTASSNSSTAESSDAGYVEEEDVLMDPTFPEEHSALDLDAWSVTITPDGLIDFFGPYTPVQLASYSKDAPRDLPLYHNWILVATVNSRLMVAPQWKDALVDALQAQGHVILPNTYPTVLIAGNAQVSISDLVRAMEAAEVDAVRVTGYGMKHQLLREGEEEEDIGQPDHPLAHTNRFDFGTTTAGENYGSTSFTVRWPPEGGEDVAMIDIKIYSRLIHLLKAGGQKAPTTTPNTFNMLVNRRSMIMKKIAQLAASSSAIWGGCRVEASVFAPTMQLAKAQIDATPLLDLKTYTKEEEHAHLYLECQTLSMECLLANSRRLLRRAQQLRIFVGRHSGTTGALHRQVSIDLCNSIGFNFGRPGKPTKWDKELPWWSEEFMLQPDLCLPSAYIHSVRFLEPRLSPAEMFDIRNQIRAERECAAYFQMIRHHLICKVCEDGTYDSYKVVRQSPLRLQCKKAGHGLQGRALREYLLECMVQRLLPSPDTANRRRRMQENPQLRIARYASQQRVLQERVTSASIIPARRTASLEVVIDSPVRGTGRQQLVDVVIDMPRALTPPLTPPPTHNTDLAQVIADMHGVTALKEFFLPRRALILCQACNVSTAQLNQDHQKSSFRLRCRLCKKPYNEMACKKLFVEYALADMFLM
ncbi:hypothetical protein CBS101457_002970 [Exobasidium rhododendri]|nr:hypothetical protein CBS101457_002970 [Exobasidium rhododendri]